MGEIAGLLLLMKINEEATFYFLSKAGTEKQTNLPKVLQPYYNSGHTLPSE